ncbi:Gar1/Naf1 RNA binding region-domain-containing protein [Amylocarpus encephaloides]|uniref:H/ACA ribonucleoprotein complex non-core subunit NAF1 n=1 Tax=Amylocarpus encephaloides TaxID=45428 RepID=A0A9P8BZ10_9HELO|nr:Gar1/Naf1 RNA binding region-domain-containing protein [Amylocarpus encephaloides]
MAKVDLSLSNTVALQQQSVSVATTDATQTDQIPMPVDMPAEVTQPNPPLTSALEALIGGLDPKPPENGAAVNAAPVKEEHPEWEVDSSPIESSSDDSSSDESSSDESEEGENSYKLLSPEEQARILMEGDGGSDDEGANKGSNSGGAQLRTKNEVAEVVIPKPDVKITEEMSIEELGSVETIVDNILLIKAKVSGEYKVLESGSVLCLADRSVIGAVAETIGRVQQPFYSVMFTNASELAAAGLEVGTKVLYSAQHSTYVFTQALKAFKGSDASNLHDEEVAADEMEFSDDEAEAEHKRRVKQKRIERRGGRAQQNGGSKGGGHPLQQQHAPYDASKGLSYDDAEDNGPYKTLSRPAGFADSVGRIEAPQEGEYSGGMNGHSQGQSREQFRGRGRGRGDRGRGRGGKFDRRGGGSSGYILPPQGGQNYPPTQSPTTNSQPPFQQQYQFQAGTFPPLPQMPQSMPSTASVVHGNTEYSPLQPQLPAWAQFPPPFPQQQFQQIFPNMPNGWSAPGGSIVGGTFINPAFFNNTQPGPPNQWNQAQRGRGRGS